MNTASTSKKVRLRPARALAAFAVLTLFIWSICLSCACGTGCCGEVSGLLTTTELPDTGCCSSPAPEPTEGPVGCCSDEAGLTCCGDDLGDHALPQTDQLEGPAIAATELGLPKPIALPKPTLREKPPQRSALDHHGPPNYLRFETFLI